MKFHYRKHKIRFDRGRMWYSIFNSVITALLVTIFSSNIHLWQKILATLLTFVLIYILGFIDEKFKLLDREQEELFHRNPLFEEMLKDIKEIKDKL